MKIHASGEDYLEAVLMLQNKKGMVRSVDFARYMGFSKPSICHAVKVLKQGGFLTMDGDGHLHLTDEGREVAECIYEKHQFFMDSLIEMGVNPKQAEEDACRIEHVISEESCVLDMFSVFFCAGHGKFLFSPKRAVAGW